MMTVLSANSFGDLSDALNPTAALRALGRAWRGNLEPTARVSVERVHFSDRRPTVIQYRLDARDGQSAGAHCARIMAECIGPEAKSHAANERRRLAKPRRGQLDTAETLAIAGDPETGLVFRNLGLDARLPGLRLLHRLDEAAEHAATALGQQLNGRRAVVRLRAHRLAKRAVLEIALGREPTAPRVFVRLRPVANDGGAAAYRCHEGIARGLAGNPAIAVPAPLRHVPELGAAFYAMLPGQPLRFDAADHGPLERALAALSAFQGLDASGWEPYIASDELNLLVAWVARIERHKPELATQVRRALARTAEALEALPPVRPVACHRDLHEGQILVGPTCAGLLDFDTSRRADPGLDAGNLVAHLRLAALRGDVVRAGIEARIVATQAAEPERIETWAGAAALRLACIYAFTEHRTTVSPLLAGDRRG